MTIYVKLTCGCWLKTDICLHTVSSGYTYISLQQTLQTPQYMTGTCTGAPHALNEACIDGGPSTANRDALLYTQHSKTPLYTPTGRSSTASLHMPTAAPKRTPMTQSELCDLGTSTTKRPRPDCGCHATDKKWAAIAQSV